MKVLFLQGDIKNRRNQTIRNFFFSFQSLDLVKSNQKQKKKQIFKNSLRVPKFLTKRTNFQKLIPPFFESDRSIWVG